MTTTKTPVQVADPEGLRASCSAMLGHVDDLVMRLVSELPTERSATLVQIVEGGGRMGVEVTLDSRYVPEIVLIGVELEGRRHVFHTVRPI
jgi:hypothetical protein